MSQSIGPIILDLFGTELTQEEKEILKHPMVGGVILFSRNYQDIEQVTSLCHSIRQAKKSPLLIVVDHEGGRVQRFRNGFTALPSMGQIGELYQHDSEAALKLAETCGWLMAAELLSVGIDLSFAPVLDLDKGINPAIGDRAFHRNSEVVTTLAAKLIDGMHAGGMAATGKHFPGHGSVNLDTHKALPIDSRSFAEIEANDLQPFTQLFRTHLQAVMPAHIIFSAVDDQPACFSKVWIQDILRKQFQFNGMIFSDDLNMEGASIAGDYSQRAKTALGAGCDMVLICNQRDGALKILDHLSRPIMVNENKFKRMQGCQKQEYQQLKQMSKWKECHEYVRRRVEYEYSR